MQKATYFYTELYPLIYEHKSWKPVYIYEDKNCRNKLCGVYVTEHLKIGK